MSLTSFFFFFQAEDGIRDIDVTGVQTCALPISSYTWSWPDRRRPKSRSSSPMAIVSLRSGNGVPLRRGSRRAAAHTSRARTAGQTGDLVAEPSRAPVTVAAVPAERDRPRDSSLIQRPDGFAGREEAGVVTAAAAVLSERAGTGTGSTALPGVLADVPVAVLLIDRGTGSVTYANSAAVELAGNVRLPVDIDTWGASVGLTDLGGQPLASTSGPLSFIAQGQPVTGEAVRMAPGRDTERDDDRLLWVTGFPLSRP